MTARPIYAIALAVVLVSPAWSAADEGAHYYARQYLSGLGVNGFTLTPIQDSYVTATFPSFAFFSLVFQQYPLSVQPPEGLNPSDVLVVQGDKVFAMIDPDALKIFFLSTLAPVADAAATMDAGRTDGAFVLGEVVVTDGGTGSIRMAMEFDSDGNLTDVMEGREIHTGDRPV
jgi:hypothetical protein